MTTSSLGLLIREGFKAANETNLWVVWPDAEDSMPKSLRSFLEDCHKEIPNEVVHITKVVDPVHYDVTAIIKHLGAMKKFPILIFDHHF